MAFDNISLVIAGIVLVIAAGYSTHAKLNATAEFPPQVPSVGLYQGWFAGLRSRLASLSSGALDVINSGYKEFSRNERSFILPGLDRSMLLVPASQIKWIVDQADSVLDSGAMQREVLQSDWTLLDPLMAQNPIHEGVVRRDLTRSLSGLIPEIVEELEGAISDGWGSDTQRWNDVVVFETMMKVVARTSNRIFVGSPLCRNDEYLENAGAFSQDVPVAAGFLRLFPEFLKPLISLFVLIPNRWHFHKCAKHLIPFIHKRIADKTLAQKNGDLKSLPNDFTTWIINELDNHPPSERTPRKIALRLMTLNFAAVHTSTFTATNLLFDLFSSPPELGYVQEIRAEIEQALKESNGVWDKVSVAKLVKTDSALRESLRISTFMSHGMDRLVTDPKGITMKDGTQLPRGSRIGFATWALHHDDDFYPEANTYDAFRFSRAREDSVPSSQLSNKQNLAKVLEQRNLSTVTTSDRFLSFGHGRHACPGRFFAAQEMKLLLAYIILNYDIKPLAERPPNQIIAGSILPPMKATMSIRRRT
ncbi:cytochrome P450 [Tricladium varicosporioides]|nr:cytochrome P450 [Hymenoscyphus varicosporioides]